MTTYEIYDQAIKPLPAEERLQIARLILDDLTPAITASSTPPSETGFPHLKHLLPQIERIRVTDEDLAGVVLDSPKP